MTQKKLHEVLHYNKNSGTFSWKINISKKCRKGMIAGHIKENGYIRISINGKQYYAHRLAWLYEYGKLPEKQIDHINHDRADNRIENLREVSGLENSKNAKISELNTSGVTGVSWCKTKNRWHSRVFVDGNNIHLGYFALFSDAVNARKNAEALYGFHDNHGGV